MGKQTNDQLGLNLRKTCSFLTRNPVVLQVLDHLYLVTGDGYLEPFFKKLGFKPRIPE